MFTYRSYRISSYVEAMSPWYKRFLIMSTKNNASSFVDYLRNAGINCLYHFTSRRNHEPIRRSGGLYSWSYLVNHDMTIPCPGGNDFSRQLDMYNGLQDYVRLSLCPEHPMAYRLRQSGEDIVVLRISIDVVALEETLFSDMNATDSCHHHGGTLEDLRRINIPATQRRFVRRDDPDFKPLQAEIMPKTFIPAKYILNLNCA